MRRFVISIHRGPWLLTAIPATLALLALIAVLIAIEFGPSWPIHRSPRLTARSAILIDGSTGRILFAKNPTSRSFPASTAKILTALVALEKAKPEEVVVVGKEIRLVPRDSSKAGLRVGDRIRLKDLIGGMMLPSGNDAAYALAVHTSRSRTSARDLSTRQAIDRFVRWMNERAARIGAVHSRFSTPDGYHDPNQITTALDLALIAREAMTIPLFREIAGASFYSASLFAPPDSGRIRTVNAGRPISPEEGRRLWENRNKLLDTSGPYYYPGAGGIKTGHTIEAGYCLVSSARRNGRELIAVVLDSSETGVWTDSIALLNFGFSSLTNAPPKTKRS